jgi:hypothetical protein
MLIKSPNNSGASEAHIYAYIHIYITDIHAHIHTHIHTYIRAHTYIHTYIQQYTHIHKYVTTDDIPKATFHIHESTATYLGGGR